MHLKVYVIVLNRCQAQAQNVRNNDKGERLVMLLYTFLRDSLHVDNIVWNLSNA